jgi:hypothetical protein
MGPPTATGRGDGPTAPAHPPTEVGDDETVAARCPHCDRPFTAERARDLHVGEVHGDASSAEERTAYEEARAAERDDLFYFHLRVVAALAVLYSAVVLLYMIALGSGYL